MSGSPSQLANPPSNDADSSPIGCWFVPLLFVIIFGVGSGWWSSQPDIISSVWANYEPVFQDNLTQNIREGLHLDFENEIWIEKYSDQNTDGQYTWIFSYDANGDTAAHFPGVPYLMAAGELTLFDRENIIVAFAGGLLSLALAILINGVRLQFGWLASLIATLVLISDGLIFQASRFQAGDTLLAALIALAFVSFVHGVNSNRISRRTIWVWPFAGAMLGATTLFQSATCFWLVFLLPAWMVYSAYHWIRRKSWGLPPEAFALFWIGVFVVAAPWWIRNCRVTGDIKPLGHAVGMNLAGAYCDEAMSDHGNLNVEKILKLRENELMSMGPGDVELLEKEAFLDEVGVSTALQWASDHRSELPSLLFGRIANHFGVGLHQSFQRSVINVVVLLGALIGCLLNWRRWGGIILMLVAISGLVTAATWSDSGRQLIPLKALIDVAFAMGVVSLFGIFQKRRISNTNQTQPVDATS